MDAIELEFSPLPEISFQTLDPTGGGQWCLRKGGKVRQLLQLTVWNFQTAAPEEESQEEPGSLHEVRRRWWESGNAEADGVLKTQSHKRKKLHQ